MLLIIAGEWGEISDTKLYNLFIAAQVKKG